MFLLVSMHVPAMACPQPGSSAWIIPVSRASAVEVEAQQGLRPSYLIVFANKAVVGERLCFPLSGTAVPQSSPLPHPTTRIQQL